MSSTFSFTNLCEMRDREREYLLMQDPGSEEYIKSQLRLLDIEKQLHEMDNNDAALVTKTAEVKSERRDRITRNIIEAVKAGAGIVLPLIGLVCITATEKDSTFTGALKDYTKLFIPKK